MSKALIVSRFKKSLKDYKANAFVQKEMAKCLCSLIPGDDFNSVLEIGCGSGLLTEECIQRIKFKDYMANDIVSECADYIFKINSEISFLFGDIEQIQLNRKYDLIISNAVFQWIKMPNLLIKKLKGCLNSDGMLLFSSFGRKNFIEIRELLGIGIDYYEYQGVVKEDIFKLEFQSVTELFKHIKNTGVNSVINYRLTRGKLVELEDKFIKRYGKIKLTYNPIYVMLN